MPRGRFILGVLYLTGHGDPTRDRFLFGGREDVLVRGKRSTSLKERWRCFGHKPPSLLRRKVHSRAYPIGYRMTRGKNVYIISE
jgi:hypothetical protein